MATHQDPVMTWPTWFDAASDAQTQDAFDAIYSDASEAVRLRQPVCDQSGRCCDFNAFGHRLYTTGLEIAVVVARLLETPSGATSSRGTTSTPPSSDPSATPGTNEAVNQPQESNSDHSSHRLPLLDGHGPDEASNQPNPDAAIDLTGPCMFQVDKLCTIHSVRPMGCRLFYCQPGTEAWQQDLYEELHDRVKQLHERFGQPYEYMEWRAGLAAARDHIASS